MGGFPLSINGWIWVSTEADVTALRNDGLSLVRRSVKTQTLGTYRDVAQRDQATYI